MNYSGDFFKANWRRPSVIALVIANLVPLFGVLIFHWSIFPLMFLFWFENLIVGLFNELRMIVAVPFVNRVLPGIPFFCIHYGGFLVAHGVIIIDLFGGGIKQYPLLADPMLNFSWHATAMFLWQIIHENHLELAVLGLTISRGISFVTDYLRCGEYRRTTAQRLFWQPYGRIIVLHAALIGGGILIKASHSPLAGLILLVMLKTAMDLAGHLWEQRKQAAMPSQKFLGNIPKSANIIGKCRVPSEINLQQKMSRRAGARKSSACSLPTNRLPAASKPWRGKSNAIFADAKWWWFRC